MALAVGGISLALGLFTVARLVLPGLEAWYEGRELALGGAVVAIVLAAFLVGMLAARRRAALTPGT